MRIERALASEAKALGDILSHFPKREGIHMSDLNYCLRKAYWRKTEDVVVDKATILNWGNGLAWQWLLLGTAETPELELDGIKLSPDSVLGIEVKETSKYPSSKAEPIEEERVLGNTSWLRQTMAYCYARNVPTVQIEKEYEWDLLVAHDMGFNKDIRYWKLYFMGKELIDNWYWMRERWTLLTEALDNARLPDVKYSEGWEHKLCPFFERCKVELEERGMV